MFGFFKRRMRREQLRMVAECRQMANEAIRSIDLSLSLGLGHDLESQQFAGECEVLLEEFDLLEAVLDRQQTLDPQTVEDLLAVWRVLTTTRDEMERGKALARQRFGR